MKSEIRSNVAYVAGCLILKKAFSTVTDSLGENVKMIGKFNNGNIDVSDETGAKIVGMAIGNNASFSCSSGNISVSLQITGSQFKGVESDTKRSFNGSANGMQVKLYDYDEGKYFTYSLTE